MSFPDSEMRDSVTVSPYAGRSSVAKKFVTPYTLSCYVEPGSNKIMDANGAEVVYSALLIGPAGSTLKALDELTWNTRRYEVIRVDALSCEGVADHIEAYLRSTA